MLEKSCSHKGTIDREDFEQVVDFASAVRMPRKDAIRVCCHIVRKAGWKPTGARLLDTRNWLSYYEN